MKRICRGFSVLFLIGLCFWPCCLEAGENWYENKGSLVPVLGPESDSVKVNVVLVHGILSNSGKWTSFLRYATEEFKKDLFVPEEFALAPPLWAYRYGIRFWTYGYDYGKLSKDVAYDLQHLIGNDRREDFRDRDLVLIGHSKGGLVCEAFLARHFADPGFADLRSIVPPGRVRLGVFIDSPFRGASPGLGASPKRREQFRQSVEKSKLLGPGGYWDPAAQELYDGRLRDFNPQTGESRIIDRGRDGEVPHLTRELAPPRLELMALFVDPGVQWDIKWDAEWDPEGPAEHRLVEQSSAVSLVGWGLLPGQSAGGRELLDWYDRRRRNRALAPDEADLGNVFTEQADHFIYLGAHSQVLDTHDAFDRIWKKLGDLDLLHSMTVDSTLPVDGAGNVPADQEVEVRLSRPLHESAPVWLQKVVTLRHGSEAAFNPLGSKPLQIRLSPDGRTIFARGADFRPGETYHVQLAGLTSPPYQFRFTITPPLDLTPDPAATEIGVPIRMHVTGATPGAPVRLLWGPHGNLAQGMLDIGVANEQGVLDHSWDTGQAAIPGVYDCWAVEKGSGRESPIAQVRLKRREPAGEFELLVEGPLHHLGDNNFEGPINTGFARTSEGITWSKAFELPRDVVGRKDGYLVMNLRGAEFSSVRLNGELVSRPQNTVQDNGGAHAMPIPAHFLRRGTNVVMVISNLNPTNPSDNDDIEFHDLTVFFGDIAPHRR